MDKTLNRIAAISTIIALIVGIYPFISSSKKEITVTYLPKLNLINNESDIKEKVKVLYNNKEVKDITKTNIKIQNTGSEPILKKDFESEIHVKIKESIILNASITNKLPTNLLASSRYTDHDVYILSGLLNPTDSFIVEIITESPIKNLPIESRITGINDFKHIDTSEEKDKYTLPYLKSNMSLGILLITSILPITGILLLFSLIPNMIRDIRYPFTEKNKLLNSYTFDIKYNTDHIAKEEALSNVSKRLIDHTPSLFRFEVKRILKSAKIKELSYSNNEEWFNQIKQIIIEDLNQPQKLFLMSISLARSGIILSITLVLFILSLSLLLIGNWTYIL